MRAKAKFWLETGKGDYLIGPRTLRLLLATDQEGSLKAGARQAGFSYRAAWDRLQEVEGALGFALLERHSGGERGGGSVLTPRARALVQRYKKFSDWMENDLEARFHQAFGDLED